MPLNDDDELQLITTEHQKLKTDGLAQDSVDSALLIEEGFAVVSIDASDAMLKYARHERTIRLNEAGFDAWSKIFGLFIALFCLLHCQDFS